MAKDSRHIILICILHGVASVKVIVELVERCPQIFQWKTCGSLSRGKACNSNLFQFCSLLIACWKGKSINVTYKLVYYRMTFIIWSCMQIYHNCIPTSTTLLLPGIPSYLQWAKTLLQHDRQVDYFREQKHLHPSPLPSVQSWGVL